MDDLNDFVDDLPHKLKIEVSLFLHEDTYTKIEFLNKRSKSFIAWACPLLKPFLNPENQYIYFEGDDITCMYFLKGGNCGFVLPKHRNIKYIDIHVGGYFGLIDIVGSIFSRDIQFNDWIQYKDILRRQFSVMSQTNCDLLMLPIHDLNKMRWEFLEAYEGLFQNAYNRLNRALKVKLHAIKFCKKNPPETLDKKQLQQLQGKILPTITPKKIDEE
mmetsp:Transcript_36132/g.55484  ORF Transcript_36132/g.55484 Transcript_36132/m.55484 type:complete len:216 (+) Transcript_36132:708-1355(+)